MVTRGKAIEVLAYTAGLLDGEGSLSINRKKPYGAGRTVSYTATVSIGSTDFAILDWLKETYGGSIYIQKLSVPTYKPFKRWAVHSSLARDFLREVSPYMRIKRELAVVLLEFLDRRASYQPRTGSSGRAARVPEAELAWRQEMCDRARALNGHPQRLSETAPDAGEAIV